jgi:hypothetical protein
MRIGLQSHEITDGDRVVHVCLGFQYLALDTALQQTVPDFNRIDVINAVEHLSDLKLGTHFSSKKPLN